MKILVLDDHKAFRDEVTDILTRNGHLAHGVETADEAVGLVADGNYDVVFVDYQMPGHDGTWFMKNASWPKKTKVLLATAHVHKSVINTMFKLGASGYLIKPFDEEDLLRHLELCSHPPRQLAG